MAKAALHDAEMSYLQIVQIRSIRTQLYGSVSEQDVFFNDSAMRAARERMKRAEAALRGAEKNLQLAKEAQTKKKAER